MSPVPLPVANTAALTAATASSSTSAAAKTGNDTTTTVNMANSNTSYRQMAQATTNGSGGSATAVATASSTTATNNNNEANKLKMATSSTNSCISAEAAAAAANVTTLQQCDSSSAASTTSENSSSSSSSSALSVKNENCDTVIKTEMENSENCSADSMQQNEANDLQLAAMKHRPILLSSMNPHIICSLCFGYLIDATTIVECLHSFCHSCLIKHLRTEQYCPRCEMMINTAKPNIKPDTTLQAIVYKLVPGLYEKELMRKRAFYKDRPEEAALASPEQRGDDTEHLIFSPSDYMSISLEYADTEELTHSGPEYIELLKPRYLKCPAMCTVAHLKKLVYGKFEINSNRFTIDIMYKVKTIILLDHYTLMDVAYIYTWKRDAPMRFYFRVKQSLRPAIRVKKNLVPQTKKEVPLAEEEATSKLLSQAMCIVHEPTPSIKAAVPETKILEPEEIKQENEAEVSSTTETPPIAAKEDEEPKQFEIVQPPQSPSISSQESNLTDKLKITIVNKAAKEKSSESKTAAKALKEKQKELHKTSPSTSATPKDERKVENIKLKIDLSKQNSVTIINMSDPERKEIVKPVRPEKEWKVTKSKKEKDGSPKSSPKSSPHSERKSKTPSPLTVPPLTIKAERISPLAKLSSPATTAPASPTEKPDEAQKSEFLKSFALTPTKNVKADKPKDQVKNISKDVTLSLIPKPAVKESAAPSPSSSSSKRKSKEPIKAVIKKPKLSPPLATEDFKIKLPPIPASNNQKSGDASATTAATGSESKKPMMPPPAPLAVMKPPSLIKKPSKPAQNKISAAPPGSLTPHPMHNNVQLAAPGSRTPIAKRYQPILPKAARPNPFANIPTDVNKILKDAGTEIKSIPNEPVSSKVYGPKADANSGTLMGPPQMAAPPAKVNATSRSGGGSSKNNSNKNNSYLNLALFNASKSKGNEVPPGCRTPMYTPNSPIYSPSSPQYAPNYNIPTMPTYKYTPKPTNPNNSYLQSVLGNNSQMSSLFPSPPVKKDGGSNNSSSNNNSNSISSSSTNNSNNSSVTSHRAENQAPKRVYPFARSPSPSEDPPEKQLKVKSLLTSCNINIPSSLSITITREDGDPSSNGSAQKHKSPVNNYIEILKLPEQTSSDNSENKRSSPPVAANSLFPNPPVKRVATPPLNATNQPKLLAPPVPVSNMQKSVTANPPAANNRPVAPTNMSVGGKNNGLNKPVANNKPTTPPSSLKSPVTGIDKKGTPSPEKRPMTSPSDQKSPKSPNGDGTGKKFRHILPRQIVAPSTPEVSLPSNKQNGNVIGTYSSPNGVNVKIHSNKKVNQSKKSPVSQQQPQQQQQQQHLSVPPAPPHQPTLAGNLKPPQQSPTNKPQIKAPTKSPQGNRTQKANQAQAQAAAATAKLNPAQNNNVMPTLPPVMPHPMQSMLPPHLGAAAAAANQNELSKFLKENLLRAQVQAAVANQSNMFYPYAANAAAAAQLGQFNPAMFNYQQAYIMDQLSRMQRAGNDAFTEYMQKLKSSMEMPKPVAAVDGSKPCDAKQLPKSASSPKSLTAPQHSPSTSSSGGANSKEQLATKTK
ncbi:polycomb group protein Psc [Musca domestica]|uniref:Polycomb group protein Psc n=1 Tax=Musca domestica TaxID=7370 RepID=A0A1I8NC34_MUSDO|nr:polycomb group protein Psc [Musca domestica]